MSRAEEILCLFKIVPTEQRVAVLRSILRLQKSPFSLPELREQMHTANLEVSHNTVVITLQLLATRKVLRAFPSQKNGKKRGRPLMLYFLEPTLKFASTSPQLTDSRDESANVKGIDFR